jgi:hypothetical protein
MWLVREADDRLSQSSASRMGEVVVASLPSAEALGYSQPSASRTKHQEALVA